MCRNMAYAVILIHSVQWCKHVWSMGAAANVHRQFKSNSAKVDAKAGKKVFMHSLLPRGHKMGRKKNMDLEFSFEINMFYISFRGMYVID